MDVTNGFANAHVRQRSAEARTALDELVRAMDACVGELRDARRRAVELGEQYDSGQSWTAIVSAETPPLVVERITITLDTLSMKGSQWRRTQALALHAEGVSINGIAALFRVTRQRISALIRGHVRPVDDPGRTTPPTEPRRARAAARR